MADAAWPPSATPVRYPLDVAIDWTSPAPRDPGLYLVARDKDGRGTWVLDGVIRVVRGPRGGRRPPRWLCWPKAEARLPAAGVMYARLTGPTWGHLVPGGVRLSDTEHEYVPGDDGCDRCGEGVCHYVHRAEEDSDG